MKTTQEYFNLRKEELRKTHNEYGYTREECLLLDASENTHFYNSEEDSADGAQYLRSNGWNI